eukprot:CAMPEP_0194536122 /NCGR_PEP_ID=MMETSP0253-20130528/74921_1 /TAXON_ID=2966 /ORGANISM="Noctiluca scintillans" /LENGTH=192 /DNA_ID=CAMNT_0039382003 /DNA_START=120 /DNA_END=698 /DNA_ORIENTATION=+
MFGYYTELYEQKVEGTCTLVSYDVSKMGRLRATAYRHWILGGAEWTEYPCTGEVEVQYQGVVTTHKKLELWMYYEQTGLLWNSFSDTCGYNLPKIQQQPFPCDFTVDTEGALTSDFVLVKPTGGFPDTAGIYLEHCIVLIVFIVIFFLTCGVICFVPLNCNLEAPPRDDEDVENTQGYVKLDSSHGAAVNPA